MIPETVCQIELIFEMIMLILFDIYENDTDNNGKPNYDPDTITVKILLLQQMSRKSSFDHAFMTMLA